MSPTTLPPLTDEQKREALDKALREFNSWRFYDCHETLEDVWRAEDGPHAGFYQGVIKVAAAFHHLLRGNHKGTVNLMTDAIRLLEPHRPACLGVDVDRLLADATAALTTVRRLGPHRLAEFDRASIPTIHPASHDAAP